MELIKEIKCLENDCNLFKRLYRKSLETDIKKQTGIEIEIYKLSRIKNQEDYPFFEIWKNQQKRGMIFPYQNQAVIIHSSSDTQEIIDKLKKLADVFTNREYSIYFLDKNIFKNDEKIIDLLKDKYKQ